MGRNAKILFTGVSHSGDSSDIFDLDAEKGTIMVSRDLLDMDGRHFRLGFVARDQGTVPKSSSLAELFIYINQSVALPYSGGNNGDGGGGVEDGDFFSPAAHNLLIVIAIAVGSGIVTVILIIAIVVIRRQDREKSATPQRYNCRTEALKMLSKDPAVHRSCSDGDSEFSGGGGDLRKDNVPGVAFVDGDMHPDHLQYEVILK